MKHESLESIHFPFRTEYTVAHVQDKSLDGKLSNAQIKSDPKKLNSICNSVIVDYLWKTSVNFRSTESMHECSLLSLQKQRHHSAVETLPSRYESQELKKGRIQISYLSRLIAASSAWSRYRSLLVSSFENIHPMESLQVATRVRSKTV